MATARAEVAAGARGLGFALDPAATFVLLFLPKCLRVAKSSAVRSRSIALLLALVRSESRKSSGCKFSGITASTKCDKPRLLPEGMRSIVKASPSL